MAKKPWVPDEAWLKKVAASYVERYPTTSAHFRRVLVRRVRKTVARHGGDAEALVAAVPSIVQGFVRLGLVDDRAYVFAKVRSLHRRGNSSRAIRGKLMDKLAPRELIDEALDELMEVSSEDFAAARYVRRRRFGPFHTDPERRRERYEKELAALARQGFSYDVARRVLDIEEVGEIEAILGR